MTLATVLFDVIDLRSFSNIWYWIMLAAIWTAVNHWVIGVPFGMIQRARTLGGDAAADLHDLVRVNVHRLYHITEMAGLVMLAALGFTLTSLVILAVFYDVELAQAVLFLVLPLVGVAVLSLRTCQIILHEGLTGEALYARLLKHRFTTQLLGIVSVFLTALFGMYQTLVIGSGF